MLIERRGSVAIVTLNRPSKHNALSVELLSLLDVKLAELDSDSDIRGIVITGNEKAFSTGADLGEALAADTLPKTRAYLEFFARANARVESLSKPVVAAIHGHCITGGLELAMCCDLRIASTDARFAVTSSRIGSVAGAGGTQRLPRLVGVEWAKDMLFSAEAIDAETALRIGLVSRVLPADEVLPAAIGRIEAYAKCSPLGVAYAKQAVNNGMQMTLESALYYERQLTTGLFATADKKEGMSAFLEKRPAKFQGC